jgi:para-nitrobenzyl esterase
MTGGGPDALALSARMGAAWLAFARSGDPAVPELPEWPPYDLGQRATMLFNDTCELARDPGARERIAWRNIERVRLGQRQE